jgi:hypothetical protein
VDPFISFGSSPDPDTYLTSKPQSLCSIRVLARGQHLLSRSLAPQGTPRYHPSSDGIRRNHPEGYIQLSQHNHVLHTASRHSPSYQITSPPCRHQQGCYPRIGPWHSNGTQCPLRRHGPTTTPMSPDVLEWRTQWHSTDLDGSQCARIVDSTTPNSLKWHPTQRLSTE